MSEKITIAVKGVPTELNVEYLSPAALEYWRAWLAHECRLRYNPFQEFSVKISVLPAELQAVATKEFASKLDLDVVPKIVLLDTVQTLAAMKLLCILVTRGKDPIDQDNYQEALPLLLPFVERTEIATSSIAEANAIRAKLGKPPLGRKPAAEQQASGQSPQGG
jgi:hypothetical protein